MKMTRKELIYALQEHSEKITGYRWCKSDCDYMIDIFTQTVTDCMAEGKEPTINGFGYFTFRAQPERVYKHPVTKVDCIVPAHTTPYFQAGSYLKKAVEGVKV